MSNINTVVGFINLLDICRQLSPLIDYKHGSIYYRIFYQKFNCQLNSFQRHINNSLNNLFINLKVFAFRFFMAYNLFSETIKQILVVWDNFWFLNCRISTMRGDRSLHIPAISTIAWGVAEMCQSNLMSIQILCRRPIIIGNYCLHLIINCNSWHSCWHFCRGPLPVLKHSSTTILYH